MICERSTYDVLVRRAAEMGRQTEALAAQCLAATERTSEEDPLGPFIGAFDTGVRGWTPEHNDYLGRTFCEGL